MPTTHECYTKPKAMGVGGGYPPKCGGIIPPKLWGGYPSKCGEIIPPKCGGGLTPHKKKGSENLKQSTLKPNENKGPITKANPLSPNALRFRV